MIQSGLELELIQEGRSPWGIRFYQDGRVEEFSDQYMEFENDEIITRWQPLEWRDIAQLNDEELELLETAIRTSGVLSLPRVLGQHGRVIDATIYNWYAALDGQENRLAAYEPDASKHAGLSALSLAIQKITAAAFNREWASEEGPSGDAVE